MNLLASASSSTFSIPNWILWGVGLAVVVTVLMYAVAWLIAAMWEVVSFGFMGTTKDVNWTNPIVAFVTYGLLPSLPLTATWSRGYPVLGVLIGVALFAAVWTIHAITEKQARRY